MGGGLMQLVAYGAQDIYLTGNPQITFFKVVYRRHTNFSMETIEQTINGTVATNGRSTITLSRNGDLVGRCYLQSTGAATHVLNSAVTDLSSVELEIGGQKSDKQSGHWMQVWAELTTPESKASGYKYLTGGFSNSLSGSGTSQQSIMVPLQFWFCRNPGLALPLIALQYHEVKLKFTWGAAADTRRTGSGTATCDVWVDYIYLDTDERRRFAQVSHEYLIEQVQFQAGATDTVSTELNFNHPVKELIWTTGFSKGVMAPLGGAYQLKLNGHDRFSARPLQYFTKQQVYDYHSGPGSFGGASDSVAVYSFALKPEEHQPSGTCNFSRIDTAQLQKTSGTDGAIKIYAVNYNVLRIMSGMGGLAYSN